MATDFRGMAVEGKIDLILQLTREQDQRFDELQSKVNDLAGQVGRMAPTVAVVAEAVTAAKVGRTAFHVLIGTGIAVMPVYIWLTDRWHLVLDLFRR